MRRRRRARRRARACRRASSTLCDTRRAARDPRPLRPALPPALAPGARAARCATTRSTPTACAREQHGAGGAARHAQDEGLRALPRRSSRRATATPLHVAWFEPEHHIVEADRAVLRAPLRQHALGDPDARAQRRTGTATRSRFGPGARRARRAAAPTPARRCGSPTTRSIFNPARLKLAHDAEGDAAQLLAQPAGGRADRAARRARRRSAAAG